MSILMTLIEVDHNTAAILQTLKVKAAALGMSLDVLLKPLTEEKPGMTVSQFASPRPVPQRNEAMFAVLRETEEMLKTMPSSGSTEDSLKLLHEGRAGRMYGYEPAE